MQEVHAANETATMKVRAEEQQAAMNMNVFKWEKGAMEVTIKQDAKKAEFDVQAKSREVTMLRTEIATYSTMGATGMGTCIKRTTVQFEEQTEANAVRQLRVETGSALEELNSMRINMSQAETEYKSSLDFQLRSALSARDKQHEELLQAYHNDTNLYKVTKEKQFVELSERPAECQSKLLESETACALLREASTTAADDTVAKLQKAMAELDAAHLAANRDAAQHNQRMEQLKQYYEERINQSTTTCATVDMARQKAESTNLELVQQLGTLQKRLQTSARVATSPTPQGGGKRNKRRATSTPPGTDHGGPPDAIMILGTVTPGTTPARAKTPGPEVTRTQP